MSRACSLLVFGALLGSASGCTAINAFEDPALVGTWELDINPDTEMDVEVNGDGDSTIFSTMGEHRYDLDWTQEDEDEFEIDFNCKQHPSGSCAQQDFKMLCEASSSGNNLDCQAQSHWDPADFEWSRD